MNSKNRVGERHATNEGYEVIIIEDFGWRNCTIKFEDGTIMYNIIYTHIKSGSVRKTINRVGEKYSSNEGYMFEIMHHDGSRNYTIKFEDEKQTILENIQFSNIETGSISNPNHRSVYSIGYEGQGEYSRKSHPITYKKWSAMLERCNSNKCHEESPTYKECTVSEEWECFQNFCSWFIKKWKPWMNSSWCLDKDIKIKGNKHYSAETCSLVPPEINTLIIKCDKRRGKYPIGVVFHKQNKNFTAQVSIDGVRVPFYGFNTSEEAFYKFKEVKEEEIRRKANKWKNFIELDTYIALMNWKIKTTD